MKLFPIIGTKDSIPYDMIAEHEAQVYLNHQQSLDRLAERGGLYYDEICCILDDAAFNKDINIDLAKKYIAEQVKKWFNNNVNLYVKKENNLRPCTVLEEKLGATEKKAHFHKWCDRNQMYVDGNGEYKRYSNYTVALVELEDGTMYECRTHNIKFTDREVVSK